MGDVVGHDPKTPTGCPGCAAADEAIAAEGEPDYKVERRPWPDGWPGLKRPYRVMQADHDAQAVTFVQVGVFRDAAEAMAAVPDGERVLQVTIAGHRRIVVKGKTE